MDNDKCKFLLMESEWEIPLAHRGWFVPLFDIKAVIYAGNVANISKFVCGHSHLWNCLEKSFVVGKLFFSPSVI